MRQVAPLLTDERLLVVHQILVSIASTRRCDFTNADMCDAANLIVELYERRQLNVGRRRRSENGQSPAAGTR